MEVERSCSAVREGCNAETCQKRAPGPPFGMWPVCLPRKYRAGEREEKGKRGQRHVLPHPWGEAVDKESSCWAGREKKGGEVRGQRKMFVKVAAERR